MADVTVFRDGKKYSYTFTPPMPLDRVLEELGLQIPHPCGGRGKCGKCAVSLAGDVSAPCEAELQRGIRLSCMTVLQGDCTVYLPDSSDMEQIELSGAATGSAPMDGTCAAAVDIGTTTLALALYDLRTGKLLAQTSMANPQGAVAADVIGRIQAAMHGSLEKLCSMIQSAIGILLNQACAKAGIPDSDVDLLILTGNTTMLYLLVNRDPSSLSCAPFQADTLFGQETQILGRRTYLPPCMNAFVGADITCAVLASGMCQHPETSLLCDIGTNGELALWKDGRLYVTSTAAGPAFEGAGISCGCGSIRGAVDRARAEDGKLTIHTIADAPVAGVCGSGLIDLIAAGLELEEIDETGAMDAPLEIGNDVALQKADIRAVQLAKAAIAAGMRTMMKAAGITPAEISQLYIAGGFGSHLNIESAVAIGLIPEEFLDKVTVIGNGSLTGSSMMLLDRNLQQQAAAIAENSTHVNLGGNPVFNEQYIEQMFFPEPEY